MRLVKRRVACRMADSGEDDVPPLEDMSELLEQAQQIKSLKETLPSPSKPSSSSSSSSPRVANDNASSTNNESVQSSGATEGVSAKKTAQAAKSTGSSGSFGGMKKGFLFGGPSKKTTSPGNSSASTSKATQKADPKPVGGGDIPLIRPKEGSGKEKHRIDEVQEALKATAPLLENKEWVTDDLLSSLEKHPRLAKQLADPRFAQAVHKFRSNPQQAMQEYRDDTEVQQFFKDFCALLGNHFSSRGGSPGSAVPSTTPPNPGIRTHDTPRPDIAVRSSTNPKQATAADEAKIQQILSDPGIREILMDQRIQRLMEALRANPDQGQGILQSADPEMRGKIHRLVEAGLLGFAP